MQKQKLVNYDNLSMNLLFWMKHFIAEKILILKPTSSNGDIVGRRESFYKQILEADTAGAFIEVIFEARKNGFKSLATFSVPLLLMYQDLVIYRRVNSIKDITTDIFFEIIEREFSKYSVNTQRSYYSSTKGFFNFIRKNSIEEKGFLLSVGYEDGRLIKPPISLSPAKSKMKLLSKKEFAIVALIIKKYKSNHSNPAAIALMLKFLFYFGVSVKDIIEIKFIDISLSEDGLFMIARNGSNRIQIACYYDVADDFTEYLGNRNTDSEYFFYTWNNSKYITNTVYDLIKRIKDRAIEDGIEKEKLNLKAIRKAFLKH